MTTVTGPPGAAAHPARAGKHWIEHWNPEDERFWETEGKFIARRNLILSIFAEHLGFSIWVLWTVIVINLSNIGIALTLPEQFWLTAIPNLIGSALRIPYTFAIARFGGRMWTLISASLLLIPVLLVAIILPTHWLHHQTHNTQVVILMLCAATAGFGGGNFSSSMANISFFYPERRKGFALGLNAAGGNLGVAVTQFLIPLVIIVGVPAAAIKLPLHHVHLAYAGLVWMPFIVVAMLCAYFYMDSLSEARTDTVAYKMAVRNPQTWIMSILYIGTFGSFIGYSFALPLVIKNTFPEFLGHHPFIANYLAGLAFVGALVGSLTRPVGGWLSDRLGGARVTLAAFLGMAVSTVFAVVGVEQHSFGLFFGAFIVTFALAGLGNGSTYRMIPSIFATLGRTHSRATGEDPGKVALMFRRQSAAVIGIAGSIGAFGGFLIQVVFRQASLHTVVLMAHATKTIHDKKLLALKKAAIAHSHENWSVPALWAFFAAYLVLGMLTYVCYIRTSMVSEEEKVGGLATATV
jgi:MFS transporter, NNP family, nitrate/nitrite transporter